MKTLTTRKFFHSPGMVKSLPPGTSVVVTDKGKSAFVVTKAGERPIKTVEDLRREAKENSFLMRFFVSSRSITSI